MKILFSIFFAIVVLTLPLSQVFGYNINETMRSIVRIESSNNYGSGTVFDEQSDSYLIITNHHVVGKNGEVKVDFFNNGGHVLRTKADVIWKKINKNTNIDLAVLKVLKKHMSGYVPLVIKLAPPNYKAVYGERFFSMGVPRSRWPMAWLGEVLAQDVNIISFNPAPFRGQSGSAIFVTIKGKMHIMAIIGWTSYHVTIDDYGKLHGSGYAMHISLLYDLMGDPDGKSDRKNKRASWRMGSKYWTDKKGISLSETVRLHK